MSDSAKGPAAGYIFQFEKALLLLANLKSDENSISIEYIDDVSVHSDDGCVLITAQAKHSISSGGTTFEDTSDSLWRTIQIWIQKLENKIFSEETIFVCSTNKVIPNNCLLRFIAGNDMSIVLEKINSLLSEQKEKLEKKQAEEPKGGESIKKTIKLIEYALSKSNHLEIIKKNIQIHDSENIKENFFSSLRLSDSNYSPEAKQRIYQEFYGWIVEGSKAKWLNDQEAIFTKTLFDEKWFIVNSSPSIINNIFRTKHDLGSLTSDQIKEKRDEIFVKQIEDIPRREEAQKKIILRAIQDFIYSEIEEAYIVEKGNFTCQDFDEFLKLCLEVWEVQCEKIFLKEFDEYTEEEKVALGRTIFDYVMSNPNIQFKNTFGFSTQNEYFRNGCFLRLSNEPRIGWHPGWTKYRTT